MSPRKTSKRITVRGLFPNAKVVRGRDWIWGDRMVSSYVQYYETDLSSCSYNYIPNYLFPVPIILLCRWQRQTRNNQEPQGKL